MELFVVFDGGGGDIDVDAADRAVLVLDRIDGVDALEDIFNRVVDRILARLDRQPLVTHILQGDDLRLDLLLRQLFAADVLVFGVIGAINTAVDAIVREIERRNHHDAVTVKVLFDLHGKAVDLLYLFIVVAGEQHACLTV